MEYFSLQPRKSIWCWFINCNWKCMAFNGLYSCSSTCIFIRLPSASFPHRGHKNVILMCYLICGYCFMVIFVLCAKFSSYLQCSFWSSIAQITIFLPLIFLQTFESCCKFKLRDIIMFIWLKTDLCIWSDHLLSLKTRFNLRYWCAKLLWYYLSMYILLP